MVVIDNIHEKATLGHPLDPLSEMEIERAVAIIRAERDLPQSARISTVVLNEPPKEVVLGYEAGDAIDREAFVVILDRTDGTTYEAVVSTTAGELRLWRALPDVQPAIMMDEFVECEAMVRAHPEFQEALRKRGIYEPELVMVDPWSNGNFGSAEDGSRRLSRALTFLRTHPGDNGYARPIEGVVVVVDLNAMEVVRIEDHGVVPLAPHDGNYTTDAVGPLRTDLKPIEITQPEGVSFEVNGWEVAWQKWRFRVGFTPREGLVLHTLSYEDAGRQRPVLYRASYSEMVVPYGDPAVTQYRKNAFDIGEYGIGSLANSLELGCDCLGEIHYFDAVLNDNHGVPMRLKNAVCLHEEDFGMLWKHVDWRTGESEVRRSRRLVVSFVATVGNYEYGFYWYLYQDGTIESEVKLTGILSTGGFPADEKPEYGTLVAPQLFAPNHQHFFNVRLDMTVDGPSNSVVEVETEAPPLGPENPHGNAFRTRSTVLTTDTEARRTVDPLAARFWKIVNPSMLNGFGEPVAYKLVPGDNVLPFAHPEASVSKRAGFITKHLWVTPYEPSERYAAGDYPNQHPGGAGLPAWTEGERPIEDTDVVVWYSFGHHHIPRPEDWPVMPVTTIGFKLKPLGFFDRSPALDVPPSPAKNGHCHC
jgi:primary-amine oxidase